MQLVCVGLVYARCLDAYAQHAHYKIAYKSYGTDVQLCMLSMRLQIVDIYIDFVCIGLVYTCQAQNTFRICIVFDK